MAVLTEMSNKELIKLLEDTWQTARTLILCTGNNFSAAVSNKDRLLANSIIIDKLLSELTYRVKINTISD